MNLDALLEAILFWRSEPLAISKLAQAVSKTEGETREALKTLENKLAERGVQLLWKDESVMLGTNPAAGKIIEKLTKEELSRDLGRASLETLTTILYKGPVSRADIDYIRGVNSSFILRHLMIRGLVERIPNPADARAYLYRPTFDLLQQLGLTTVEDLPDYASARENLKS